MVWFCPGAHLPFHVAAGRAASRSSRAIVKRHKAKGGKLPGQLTSFLPIRSHLKMAMQLNPTITTNQTCRSRDLTISRLEQLAGYIIVFHPHLLRCASVTMQTSAQVNKLAVSQRHHITLTAAKRSRSRSTPRADGGRQEHPAPASHKRGVWFVYLWSTLRRKH